jgi:hypothetical protein
MKGTSIEKSDDNKYLFFEEDSTLEIKNVIKTTRFGLTLKNKENLKLRVEYIIDFYRYIIFPDKISKGKNQIICTEYYNNKNSYDGFDKKFNCKKKSILNWISYYNNGKEINDEKKFIGIKFKVDDICELHGYLLNKINN